jgi:predicted RNase H-like HicB family nuclease
LFTLGNNPAAMTAKFTAVIERDADGFYAYCPELKGCQTQGDTEAEALANLREAAELYLETLTPQEKAVLAKREVHTTLMELSHA